MKKLFVIISAIAVALFIFNSCEGNQIELDAKKAAEMSCKIEKLQQQAINSKGPELIELQKLSSELIAFTDEIEKKYTSEEDKMKFKEAFNNALIEYCGSESGKLATIDQPTTGVFSEILEKNYFQRSNGLLSIIFVEFLADNQYSMRVLAGDQGEIVNVRGTYQIVPKDDSEAMITLMPGPIQKSAAYNTFDGFDVDVFVVSNIQYTLRKFRDSDAEKLASENPTLALTYAEKNILPSYVLDGSIVFYSNKRLTQADRDSIAAIESTKEKKAADLEEKLKGL
jgi:hypothetical protein